MKSTATKRDQIIVRVIADPSDPQNKGYAYQVYAGSTDMRSADWVLVSSGAIVGNRRLPSRRRVLRSAAVRGNRYVTIVWDL